MAGRPPGTGGTRLTEEHRDKIRKSNVLSRLIAHAEGDEDVEMSATQVTAALGLLKKALPDLSAVTLSGDEDAPLEINITIGGK
jgi:hypothetical protein